MRRPHTKSDKLASTCAQALVTSMFVITVVALRLYNVSGIVSLFDDYPTVYGPTPPWDKLSMGSGWHRLLAGPCRTSRVTSLSRFT
jgi:hypothetical protein